MRINNISANAAFGRVVKVDSISNPARKRVPVDESTYDISKVLNGYKTERYSDKEAERIREFFKDTLGDYDGENDIMMRKVGKDIFLLSGEDAAETKTFLKSQIAKAEKYEGKRKNEYISNAYVLAGRRILKKAENGENGKPYSVFELKSNYIKPEDLTLEQFVGLEPIGVKFNQISYQTDKPDLDNDFGRKKIEYFNLKI